MAIIDKISVGGTVYDIGGSGGADNGLVTAQGNVEGFVAYPPSMDASTITYNGVTITREGYRVTLNGTDTSSDPVIVRLTGTLYAKTGDLSGAQVTGGGITLPNKNGSIYRMAMRLVSGTVTHSTELPRPQGYASSGVSSGTKDATADGSDRYCDYYNNYGNGATAFGIRYQTGTVFTNAVYEYTVVDTESLLGVGSPVIEVSGTSATINALEGACYVCGELTALTFKPAVNGLCEVIFESGTTPTALTISKAISSHTIHMPPWWTGVEASKTYDIVVRNGELVGVSVW